VLRQQADARLLTLVGVGGMGKTRLALEVARANLDNYADGVFFVALAPLTAAETIVSAIVRVLGVTLHGGDPTAALLRWVDDKQLLLILDNFEHLLEGVGLVVELLEAAPQMQIIATSRERLNVRGEQVYGVEGLEYGQGAPAQAAATSAAIRLFVEGARRAHPPFRLRVEELPALQRICELVGGMPLGLELAAAWAGVLSPEEIANEIARDVDFLQARWADVPERQGSMRVVFEWSWRRLSETERQVLHQLSVFRGGFTRAAAETIAGGSLRVLVGLHHKSLLHWRPADGAAGRYELHELLRQFAAEQLDAIPAGQKDSLLRRHATYFLGWRRRQPRNSPVDRSRSDGSGVSPQSSTTSEPCCSGLWSSERSQPLCGSERPCVSSG
jgi:predicted ATPase